MKKFMSKANSNLKGTIKKESNKIGTSYITCSICKQDSPPVPVGQNCSFILAGKDGEFGRKIINIAISYS